MITDNLDVARIILLWLWAFGLGCIEIEIEGGHGSAERLPTWYLMRGRTGRVYRLAMGQRPLTGYHVFAFTIPLVIVHLPFAFGLDWSLSAELSQLAIYFALAVIWDYIWFVIESGLHGAPLSPRERLVVPGPLDLAISARLLHGNGTVGRPRRRRRHRRGQLGPGARAALADRGADRPDGARGPGIAPVSPLVPTHAPRRRRRSWDHPQLRAPAPDQVWDGGTRISDPLDRPTD